MTVVVVWHRAAFGQIWCASDSRISSPHGVITEQGAKILPVNVVSRYSAGGSYLVDHQFSLGFAFAGSTLSALSTYSIVNAAAQNLRPEPANIKGAPPTVEMVAQIMRRTAQHVIGESAARMPNPAMAGSVHFESILFGFCPASNRYRGFVVVPNLAGGYFQMVMGELDLRPGAYHCLGSGAKALEEFVEADPRDGPMGALSRLVRSGSKTDVGGHILAGIAGPDGFTVHPVLHTDAESRGKVTIVGIDVGDLLPVSDFAIGYAAIAPDAPA